MTNHPITPPPELVRQWLSEHFGTTIKGELSDLESSIATRAAQWGYDQHERALLDAMHSTVPPDLVMPKAQLFEIDPHPAIPPADQLKEWEDLWFFEEEHADVLLIRAFQAGADQELEACCEVLHQHDHAYLLPSQLRDARRPKPMSLAEQALEAWEKQMNCYEETDPDMNTIRRALERLQKLENNQ